MVEFLLEVLILSAPILIVAVIIIDKQYKAAREIMEEKGYSEDSEEWRKWHEWSMRGRSPGYKALATAMMMPPNPNRKSKKEREYILGEDYIFRGFGKEGEMDPKELIEPIPDDWWECQHCGKANAPYVGSCGCGCDRSGNMLVKASEQGQSAAPVEKTLPQELSCPSCGKQIGPEANFCQYCGAKI